MAPQQSRTREAQFSSAEPVVYRVADRVVRRLASVLAAVIVLLAGAVGFAPGAGAQTCAGSVSTTVAAASLPGGSWSVDGGCLTSDAFFEYSNTEGRAQVAVSSVTYADGHAGRVAVGMLVMAGGTALSIVGVEDSATGLVKWSAVLGTAQQVGDQPTVSGSGFMVFPLEVAQVSATIAGTGTNITTLDSTAPTITESSPTPITETTTAPPADPAPPTSLAPESDGNRLLPAPIAEDTGPTDSRPTGTGPIDTGPIDTSAVG